MDQKLSYQDQELLTVLVLMARTGDARSKRYFLFSYSCRLPGIEYGKNEPKMGWKNQPTRLVSLTDVKGFKE